MWSPGNLRHAVLLSTTGAPEAALRITDRGIADAMATRQGTAMSLRMVRSLVLLEGGSFGDAQAEA